MPNLTEALEQNYRALINTLIAEYRKTQQDNTLAANTLAGLLIGINPTDTSEKNLSAIQGALADNELPVFTKRLSFA